MDRDDSDNSAVPGADDATRSTPGGGDDASSTLPVSALERVDQACKDFEAAWRRGERPRIEDHLRDAISQERAHLLRELILLDLDYRHKNRERPTQGQYERRFPKDTRLISEIDFSVPESIPECIGPYAIVRKLGEGGMGVVYLAEQASPIRRTVALKIIKLGMDTEAVVARFEAERQALALMNHPHIARVLDAGATDKGRPYFVMEHVPGRPITEHCDRERCTIRERLGLLIQVCTGLQHAHQKTIIHRDIKPSNVLVMAQDGDAVPKIIDFGIAKAIGQRLTERTLYTERGQIIGTPAYMSPEQADPTTVDIDTRTDVYSLGVLLYELLTGVLPFDSPGRWRDYAELERAIREEEPRRPSSRLSTLGEELKVAARSRRAEPRQLLRQLRGDLDWITMKALAKDPNRRYPTVLDLAADVRRHLSDDPVLAGPPSIPYRLKKFLRKRRRLVAGGFALFLVAAVVAGVFAYIAEKRFRRNVEAGREAVAEGDLTAASKTLAWLEESNKNHREVVALAVKVDELDRTIKISASRELRDKGGRRLKEFLKLRSERRELKEKKKQAAERYEPWQPIWERRDEVRTVRRLCEVEEQVPEPYNEALLLLHQALETAPPGSKELRAVRQAIEQTYWEGHQALEEGQVALSAAFFRNMIRSYGLGAHAEELAGSGEVTLETDPPGAEVFCFRYESHEAHLVPLPFDAHDAQKDPKAGLLEEPFLEVEKVWDEKRSPFRDGDRFVKVRGRNITLRGRGDLAQALKETGEGETIQVEVLRAGEDVTLPWTPFPERAEDERGSGGDEKAEAENPLATPGRVVDIYEQFGFTFAGYPLHRVEGNRLGETQASGPIGVKLPRGSYLFVFRREGYAEARLPVSVSFGKELRKVRLFKESEVPQGYVHIPAGSFPYGGDSGAYESLESGTGHLGDFFMRRLEVTFGEYLEFVNHPEVLGRIIGKSAKLEIPDEQGDLKDLLPEDRQVQLIPGYSTRRGEREWLLTQDKHTKKWVLVDEWHRHRPVFAIPMLAGLEYARWLTKRHGYRWRFRLPKDLEWEKAARGVDRRRHVWGDHLVLNFCDSGLGSYGKRGRRPDRVGVFPLDESVYGVRDLAGSVSEPTATRATVFGGFYVLRGGNWETIDRRDYCVATRNRRLAEKAYRFVGLRLVAEPAP